jgi:two-component system phosphate regulon response regulator PhoB
VSEKLPPKILVIEFDELLNANLCNTIERYYFDVTRVKDCESAIKAASANLPNVAIISSELQDISAIEMLSKLREVKGLKNLPVAFLIDQGKSPEDYNIINNDFVKVIFRPCTPNELMVNIRSLLRQSSPVFQDKFIKYKDISIDLSTYRVFRGNKQIHFGPTEFKILQLFTNNPEHIYSRKEIIDYVWGSDKEIAHRTIDVHINRIRKAMDLKDGRQVIKTIRANGYCLD